MFDPWHQEVCFTPVTKVPKLIVVFWDLVGAIQKTDPERLIPDGSYKKIGEQYSSSNEQEIKYSKLIFQFLE